jgi:hypothetical protein
MPLVLVTTAGDATANAYASLVDAEAYALTLPVATDWTSATDPQKNAALVQATRMMDTLTWNGVQTNPGVQVLRWPRSGVVLPDSQNLPNIFGLGYAQTVNNATIPAKIRDACCEFAIRLITDDRAADAGGLAPETVKLGSMDLGRMVRRPIPASVLEMIRDFLVGGGQTRMVRS